MMLDRVQPIGRSFCLANQRRAVCQLWLQWARSVVRSLQNVPPTGHLRGHCLSRQSDLKPAACPLTSPLWLGQRSHLASTNTKSNITFCDLIASNQPSNKSTNYKHPLFPSNLTTLISAMATEAAKSSTCCGKGDTCICGKSTLTIQR